MQRWVHPKFPLLKTQQKQFTQTIANKSVDDGVYNCRTRHQTFPTERKKVHAFILYATSRSEGTFRG